MQEIKFNINDYVKVKLTSKGVQILKDKHDKLQEICSYVGDFKLKLDEDGYYKAQLHSIFADFGEYVGIAQELAFETNIIFLKED